MASLAGNEERENEPDILERENEPDILEHLSFVITNIDNCYSCKINV